MAKKPTNRKVTQLDRIEKMVRSIESRLANLNAFETLQEALSEHKDPETFKVGDWVVSDRHDTCILRRGVPYKVKSLIGSSLVFDVGEFTDRQYIRDSFRRATKAEIDAHLKSIEQSKLNALKFGTIVGTPNGDGVYLTTTSDGYLVGHEDGGMEVYELDEITLKPSSCSP